jgi:hypothetical protein
MEDAPAQPNETPERPERPEGLLYHYTDQAGLEGILENNCIWATHSAFLNDASERKIGLDIFRTVMDTIRHDNKTFLGVVACAWEQTFQNYLKEISAYSISFSRYREGGAFQKCNDRLSQWRGYSNGRQGYCLGFSYRDIYEASERLSMKIQLAVFLRDCNYDMNDSYVQMNQEIRALFGTLERLKDKYLRDRPTENQYSIGKDNCALAFIHDYAARLLVMLSVFKHPGFFEESETRLIVLFINKGVSRPELIKHRSAKSGDTPYIEVPIGIRNQPSSLAEITVGPSVKQEQAIENLKILLQQKGLHDVKVVSSQIPYRNW